MVRVRVRVRVRVSLEDIHLGRAAALPWVEAVPRLVVACRDALRVALARLAVLRAALDALVVREGPDAVGRVLERGAAEVAW